jgi:Flp pilus assembly pilin Flp
MLGRCLLHHISPHITAIRHRDYQQTHPKSTLKGVLSQKRPYGCARSGKKRDISAFSSAMQGLYVVGTMRTGISGIWRRRRSAQRAQGMVEYAMILVMASIAALIMLFALGGQITTMFSNVVLTLATR